MSKIPTYTTKDEERPERYIPLAYGSENELRELAEQLAEMLNLAILRSNSFDVCQLVIIFGIHIDYRRPEK